MVKDAILKCYFHDTAFRIYKNAMDFTGSVVDEQMYGAIISSIKKLTKFPIQNTMRLRRQISDKLISENQYFL